MPRSSAVITVIPARLDWLEALLQGDEVFAARFDTSVAAGWVGFPDALPYALDAARRHPDGDEWGAHLFFEHADHAEHADQADHAQHADQADQAEHADRAEHAEHAVQAEHAEHDGPGHAHVRGGTLVGFGGWKGPPVDGEAELGYAVAPSRQGRGIATAVVRELVDHARMAGISVVTAHTLDEPNPSTSVLERCGFTLTAEVPDAELGTIWRWELPLRDDGAPVRQNVLERAVSR